MLKFGGINIPINTYEKLKGISLGNPEGTLKWPIVRANGYPEIFVYENRSILRWVPNLETHNSLSYTGIVAPQAPISWFYDKVIGDSMRDTKTGEIYPAESTPNYEAYRKAELPPERMILVVGRFYRIPFKPEIYRYDVLPTEHAPTGYLRHVPDLETFEAMGRPTVFEIDQATFDATPKGPPLPSVKEEPPEEIVGPVTEHRITCPQCSSVSTVFECLITEPGAYCPISEFPLQNCPVCGYKIVERAKRIEVIERKLWPPISITTQVACPQCYSTLQIIPPSPGTVVTQVFTWLTCPVCGYPRLVQVPTGGFRVEIVSKQPWPLPTYSEEVAKQQDEWITGTTSLLQQMGLPWSSLPFSYVQPGQIALNGRVVLPAEGGIPPSWKTYPQIPVGIPDYSVEQRIQEASGQEPWQLAEVVAPAPPKKITPYLILAGLGITTVAVWYYKKKKKGVGAKK